jgi:hypothetical protein
MRLSFRIRVSLAPGFSPVFNGSEANSRFNGFWHLSEKPLKRLNVTTHGNHRAEARC